jgi:hypothetical protein
MAFKFPMAVVFAVVSLLSAAHADSSAVCASRIQPGCVLPQGEPDMRTIRERLRDPVPALIERPEKQRALLPAPSFQGPPVFLDIQSPRAIGR